MTTLHGDYTFRRAAPLTKRAFSDPGVFSDVTRDTHRPHTSPSRPILPTTDRKHQAKKSPVLSRVNEADKLESALVAIRSVLDHTSPRCTIDNVSVHFYEELDAAVRGRADFVGWEGARYAT